MTNRLIDAMTNTMTDTSGDTLNDRTLEMMMYFSQDDFDVFMDNLIKRNDKHKIKCLKHGHALGLKLSYIIYVAIEYNDVLIIALCMRYGEDLNQIVFGDTYAHMCVFHNRTSILKSFIKNGIDMNKLNDKGHTPLELAFFKDHKDCIQLLIESGVPPSLMVYKEKMQLALILLDTYEPTIKKLFEIVVSKTKSLKCTEPMFASLRKKIMLGEFDPVQIVLSKFPNFLNKVHCAHTLLYLLIEIKCMELARKFIKLPTTCLRPNGIAIPYLHQLCFVLDIESINYVLEKDPTSINVLCIDKRTPVDYVLLGYNLNHHNVSISVLRILIEHYGKHDKHDKHDKHGIKLKCNTNQLLNNRNKLRFRTIETAIQFTNGDVVEFLINNGCDIWEPTITDTEYVEPIINNDPLAFASKFDKVDIIDVLLKHNITINLFDGMPTSLLYAIETNSENAFKKLMSESQIASMCKTIGHKLLNHCVNTGNNNKNIMKYFVDEESLNLININQDTALFNKIEKVLELHIDDYQYDKIDILEGLASILTFLKSCSEFGINKIKQMTNYEEINLVSNYFDAMTNFYFDDLKQFVLNFHFIKHSRKFRSYFDIVTEIITSDDSDLCELAWAKLQEIQIKRSYDVDNVANVVNLVNVVDAIDVVDATDVIDTLKNLINLIQTKLKSNIVIQSNETINYSIHTNTKNDERYIKIVLSQLARPIKMPHYDEMYDRIQGLNCTVVETSTYVLIRDNKTHIISVVFNDGTNQPTKSFKYYNFNIGKENKCDVLHMFPFSLDKKLSKMHCYEKWTNDVVNKFGEVQLLYFHGMLIHGDEYMIGLYEYFIDATGSLFHRFFKPNNVTPYKIKNNIMCNFDPNSHDKIRMVKDLIKSL